MDRVVGIIDLFSQPGSILLLVGEVRQLEISPGTSYTANIQDANLAVNSKQVCTWAGGIKVKDMFWLLLLLVG